MGSCCSLNIPPIQSQKLILRYNQCGHTYTTHHSGIMVYEPDYETTDTCDYEWCDELNTPPQKCAKCWLRFKNDEFRDSKYPYIQYKISNWVTTLDKLLPQITTKSEMRTMTFRYNWLSNVLTFRNPNGTIYGKFTFISSEKNVISRIQKYLETD